MKWLLKISYSWGDEEPYQEFKYGLYQTIRESRCDQNIYGRRFPRNGESILKILFSARNRPIGAVFFEQKNHNPTYQRYKNFQTWRKNK